jgi:uncharacterized protein YjbJ (UPF0337 family)
VTDGEKAGEARKAMVDSVKGKAKEIAGAVTGNDSLTAEGQLEQTEAKERRDAAKAEAEADAEAAQALSQVDDAKREGSEGRLEAGADAAAAIARVRGEEVAAKAEADQAGSREAVQEQAKAEMDAQREIVRAKVDERAEVETAAEEYSDAVDEHRHSVSDAVRTQAEANQARRLAETIEHTDDRS